MTVAMEKRFEPETMEVDTKIKELDTKFTSLEWIREQVLNLNEGLREIMSTSIWDTKLQTGGVEGYCQIFRQRPQVSFVVCLLRSFCASNSRELSLDSQTSSTTTSLSPCKYLRPLFFFFLLSPNFELGSAVRYSKDGMFCSAVMTA